MPEYTKRHAVWHNKDQALDTPITAGDLQAFDDGLDKLLGKDTPNDGDVGAWSTAAGGVLWSPPAPTSAGTSGTLAARPSAASASGRFYLATDQNALYFSDGSAWSRVGIPAGATQLWFSAAVPTGYVAYDGGTLGGSTGIYADLYAHLGNTTTLPDTRGRMPVGKGTHADVDTIGDNDGVAVGSRRPIHKHQAAVGTLATGNDTPDHTHNTPSDSGALGGTYTRGGGATYNLNVTTTGASTRHTHPVTGAPTVGPQTGSEPTDGPAWITFLFIAKL